MLNIYIFKVRYFFVIFPTLFFSKWTKYLEIFSKNGKDTPPEVGRAAEAFQSPFRLIDGKIRDGYGVDGSNEGGWYCRG
jgi:hypothetical protein